MADMTRAEIARKLLCGTFKQKKLACTFFL